MISIEDTKNEIAWENGFISWSDVELELAEGGLSVYDLNILVEEIARRYSRDAEGYYMEEDY